jgi:hypothetical protein
MKYGWVVLCLAFFGLAILALSTVSAIEPARATNSIGTESNIAISDKYVLWSQSAPSGMDLYVLPTAGGGGATQVTSDGMGYDAIITGDRVLWVPNGQEVWYKNLTIGNAPGPLVGGLGINSHISGYGDYLVFMNASSIGGGKSQLVMKYYTFSNPGAYLVKTVTGSNVWGMGTDVYKNRAIYLYQLDNVEYVAIQDLPGANPNIQNIKQYVSNCKLSGNTGEFMICDAGMSVLVRVELPSMKVTTLNLHQPLGGMGSPSIYGNTVLYENITDDNIFGFDLYTVQMDTGLTTRITYDQAQEAYAYLSNNWVAYQSIKDGQPDVYYFMIPKQPPDLVIRENDITIDPAVPVMGDKVTINVTVLSKGAPMKVDAKLFVTVTDPAGNVMPMSFDVLNLPPDTPRMVSTRSPLMGRGYATVVVGVKQIVAANTPQEINLGNNKAIVKFYVADRPKAAIASNITKDNNMTYSSIHFSGAGSFDLDGINLYIWNFDDGTTLLGPEVDHRWAKNGQYHVMLSVYDIYGVRGQTTYNVTIANQPPVIVWSVPQVAARNTTVVLSAAGSYDPDGQIIAIWWEIDAEVGIRGNILEGTVVQTMFTTSNDTVAVILHVVDDNGTESAEIIMVSLVDAKAHNVPPIAVIQMTGNGLNVTFSGLSSFDPNGKVVSYIWTFSDNTTLTGAKVNKSFAPGTYIATLKVKDDEGLDGTTTAAVTLSYVAPPTIVQKINQTVVNQIKGNPPPTCWAKFSYDNNVTKGNVKFTGGGAEKGGLIVKYDWDFDGDGTWDWSSTTTGNTSHVYDKPAFYMALFRATDGNGTSVVTSLSISIRPNEIGAKPVQNNQGVGMPTLLLIIVIAVVCAVVIAAVVGYVMSKKVATVKKDEAAEQEVAEIKKLVEESKTTGANIDEAEALINQFEGK